MSIHTYIPTLKKIAPNNNILVERALPKEGTLTAKIGDKVEPFKEIGVCNVSYELILLGERFRPESKLPQKLIEKDKLVGKAGKAKFLAPFPGYLELQEKEYVFRSEEKEFLLLPGVWGEVSAIKDHFSVLIKTQAHDIHMPIATKQFVSGELIVFPNPGDYLGLQYLNNYLKSPAGKIVYVGNTVTADMLSKAKEQGVAALVAGSCTKEVFDFAQSINMGLGIFTQFGLCDTPDIVYSYLTEVSSRYVFFQGEKFVLRVPINKVAPKSASQSAVLKYVRKGLVVQVFDKDHFGKVGTVDSVSKSGIFVQLQNEAGTIEVKPPNLLALE